MADTVFQANQWTGPIPEDERFFPKVEFVDKWFDGTRCLEWTAYRDRKGYGMFTPSPPATSMVKPYRWLYERWVGPIPDGLHIDHLCRNPPCCNPMHLEPVTSGENSRRGLAGAHMAAKTHCPQGHPYAGDNLQVDSRGRRVCLSCRRSRDREAKRKERARRRTGSPE